MHKIVIVILFFLQTLVMPLYALDRTPGIQKGLMGADEVKRGMKGTAWTVFHGWEAEPFDVEIIDVIQQYFAGYPMILARGTSSNVIRTGIAAGMSGSPVYINGKLIGAVAFTWSFSKEPIFGITPIKAMLDLTNAIYEPDQNEQVKQIETPLMLSGFSGKSFHFLTDFFSSKGFRIGESVSGLAEHEKRTLVPGAGVAINMVDGDLVMAAIGTVTYTNGNGIWIFGHPMEKFGNVSLPVSRAYIHTILPSRKLSFKMGTSSLPVGSTVYDGKTAVYCEKGIHADMVPVELSVQTPGVLRHYAFRVAKIKEYFPSLTVGAISSSLENTVGTYDEKTMDLTLRITLESENRTIELTNRFHYAFNPVFFDQFAMMMDLSSYFGRFLNFDWQKFEIKKVQANVLVSSTLRYAILEGVQLDRSVYTAGENVSARVVLRSYKNGYRQETLQLRLPQNIKPGNYVLVVGNDFVLDAQKVKLSPTQSRILTGDDLLRWSSQIRDSRSFGMAFYYPIEGLVLRDRKLSGFPRKYARLLSGCNTSGKKRSFVRSLEIKKQENETVYGSRSFSIEVKKNSPRKVIP